MSKNLTRRIAMAAIATGMVAAPLASANAFKLSDLDPTKIIRKLAKANVNVHNSYPFPIKVVMDSNREAHVIASGGVAKFTRANKGDRPTFRAYRNGAVVNSKQVFLDGNKTVHFR